MDPSVIAKLCTYLRLEEEQVFYSEAPLNLSFLGKVRDMLRRNRSLFIREEFRSGRRTFPVAVPL